MLKMFICHTYVHICIKANDKTWLYSKKIRFKWTGGLCEVFVYILDIFLFSYFHGNTKLSNIAGVIYLFLYICMERSGELEGEMQQDQVPHKSSFLGE